ncbi:extracellular solute-binding protein [Paenibacillus koleovorans]|uniref:extracellular solute-binding protein n=1 Tax=Paenibacillus koleovorans TaxID=121608 RepID=UPI000FDC3325|nr:extracellular solute-binding protein [Paenibacillus koleovorans]
MLRRRNLFQERYDAFIKELRNEILSGSLLPGEFILPENTLSEKYQISRVSVRKVLAQLVEEGLIEKIAGKGNRVKLPEEEIPRQTLKLIWFSGSYETDIIRKIIDRYEKVHPYVRVELIILPSEDYVRHLTQMMEEGGGPDLFFVSDYHMREFLAYDKLDHLLPYDPEGIDAERDSYPVVFDMFREQGRLMAVPVHFSPVVICYNKEVLAEAGIQQVSASTIRSWDDLLAIAKQCTEEAVEHGMMERYGFCFSSSSNRWPAFIMQNGGRFMDDNGKSAFDDKRNAEALQFCVDLMYKHHVSPIYSHGSSFLAESLFRRGRMAMIMSTYYFMNEFRGMNLNWDLLPLPGQANKGTILLGGALGINKHGEKTKVAQSLIEFMIGPEAQTILKRNGCTIPVRREIAENDRLLDPSIHPQYYNAFTHVMPYAQSLQGLGLSQSQLDLLNEELHVLWANMETPESACERVSAMMDQLSPNARI